jgi:hypothetical protein
VADWFVEEAPWSREQLGIARPAGFGFFLPIQIRDDSFEGDRPSCPRGCRGKPHRHGFYLRYAAPTGSERIAVFRFLCRPCGLTISVLSAGRLPYRSLHADRLQAHADRQAGVGQGPDPPPGVLEAGCLRRAWARLRTRVEVLKNAFGPLVSSTVHSVEALWLGMRHAKGTLPRILGFLATTHKISLLGDYRCLRLPDESPTAAAR